MSVKITQLGPCHRDGNCLVVLFGYPNQQVMWSADRGTISALSNLTDGAGIAVAQYYPPPAADGGILLDGGSGFLLKEDGGMFLLDGGDSATTARITAVVGFPNSRRPVVNSFEVTPSSGSTTDVFTGTWSFAAPSGTVFTAGGLWSGTRSGTGTELFSGLPAGTGVFSLTALTPDGLTATGTDSVVVTQAPASLTFSADPNLLGLTGGSSLLQWAATGVSGVLTASGAWSGTKPLTGSETVMLGSGTGISTYTLSGSGTGGSVSGTATITRSASEVGEPGAMYGFVFDSGFGAIFPATLATVSVLSGGGYFVPGGASRIIPAGDGGTGVDGLPTNWQSYNFGGHRSGVPAVYQVAFQIQSGGYLYAIALGAISGTSPPYGTGSMLPDTGSLISVTGSGVGSSSAINTAVGDMQFQYIADGTETPGSIVTFVGQYIPNKDN